jgi:DNA-directed RNA polymerase subunit RPC12/RpoP
MTNVICSRCSRSVALRAGDSIGVRRLSRHQDNGVKCSGSGTDAWTGAVAQKHKAISRPVPHIVGESPVSTAGQWRALPPKKYRKALTWAKFICADCGDEASLPLKTIAMLNRTGRTAERCPDCRQSKKAADDVELNVAISRLNRAKQGKRR